MKEYILLRLNVLIFLALLTFLHIKELLPPWAIMMMLLTGCLGYFIGCYVRSKKRVPPS